MSTATSIEWTDSTWNPVVGCSIVSPGCTNCYAMRMAARIERMNPAAKHYRGLTRYASAQPVWSGVVRTAEDAVLFQPLRWRRSRRVFVNSMSDLFHESLSDEQIARVFAIMALTPRHTYQVLTKRAGRMQAWFAERWQGTPAQRWDFGHGDKIDLPAGGETGRHRQVEIAAAAIVEELNLDDPNVDSLWTADGDLRILQFGWPLPNVWLGVSTERQTEAELRVPSLLATPAAKRFISAEPLLGPLRLDGWLHSKPHDTTLDWVIAGGESGPRARWSDAIWYRMLRDKCVAARVPFFFKQWGAWGPVDTAAGETMQRVAKKVAGAILDGVAWRQFPE